jgi:hypothetical protein
VVVSLLEDLLKEKLLYMKNLAAAEPARIDMLFQRHGLQVHSLWMVYLARDIIRNHNGRTPDDISTLLELQTEKWHHHHTGRNLISHEVARSFLQDAYGFQSGLVLDTSCRAVLVATEMVDSYEYLNDAQDSVALEKATAVRLEKSLKTWIAPGNWQGHQATISSFIQLLWYDNAEAVRHEINRLLKARFVSSDQQAIVRWLNIVAGLKDGET